MWDGVQGPNWHTQASQTLVAMSVLRYFNCLTWRAQHQDRLDPGRLQSRKRRLSANPGPFHERSLDAMLNQPGGYRRKPAGEAC